MFAVLFGGTTGAKINIFSHIGHISLKKIKKNGFLPQNDTKH
jgi:hypothetical protein